METSSSRIQVPINPEPAEIMHIDLNGAFAMTEQQWRPHLRHRPVGVTNRLKVPGTDRPADWSICITTSYEAKSQGIKLGTQQRVAREIDPNFIMVESDPSKYIHVHRKLLAIFQSYSPRAYMKSIDEGIIDFRGMRRLLKGRSLKDIGREIKQRVKEEVGDYMTINVGIGQNLWLAKVAASLHKPDGLDLIEPSNLREVYANLKLTDLPYIKRRNQVRLNLAGIYTTLQFLEAPYWLLFRQAFGSVLGHQWYLRLRGYEMDDVEFDVKTSGRSYVLERRTADRKELLALLHKAAFKVSRKLYTHDLAARGLSLHLRYGASRFGEEGGYAGKRIREKFKWKTAVYREDELFQRTRELFDRTPQGEVVTAIALTAYGLQPAPIDQPALFEDRHVQRERIQSSLDTINDRYGEMTVVPADIKMSCNPMKDKIPFYSTKYFEITSSV